MKEVKIEKCQFCGGEEIIECNVATTDRLVYASTGTLRSTRLFALVCRDCGSVVHTFCKAPEKLVPKNERRQEK